MGEQVTGRVKEKVDGELLRSKPGATIQIGGVKRNPMPNDQGTTDFKTENVPAMVKATLHHVANTDLPALLAFQGGTVIWEGDNNISYTVPGAFTQELGELKDGEVEVTFGGDPAI